MATLALNGLKGRSKVAERYNNADFKHTETIDYVKKLSTF